MTGKRAHAPHDFELNLTPIIDCFVTLICFLLLSATYVSLVGMEAKVPIAVPASSVPASTAPKFKLELNVKTAGVELVATGAGPASGRRWIPRAAAANAHDLAALRAELAKIKRERPTEFSIHFNSETDLSYEELIRFMETARNSGATAGTAPGATAKDELLFPDFIIANLAAAPQGK